jgi:hypothetical protein
MLTKPSVAALTALAQFVETPRWRDVDELLQLEIEAVTKRLLGARENADVHELRGRLATLREFRQTASEARNMLALVGKTTPLA